MEPTRRAEPTRREVAAAGELSVIKLDKDTLAKLSVDDIDLKVVADPYQVVVRAQLDNNGIRVEVRGNARFGDENDLGRDDGATARSHAAFTVPVDEDDQRRVAALLADIAAKYKERAVNGALTSAFTAPVPKVEE